MSDQVDIKYMRWLRRLQHVPRWSVVPTIRQQNVATHSYYVACICMFLLQFHRYRYDLEFCMSVMRLALTHDIVEAADGDAPSPSKKQSMIRDQAYVVMKVADILEAYMFTLEERYIGNTVGNQAILEDLEERLAPWVSAFMHDEKITSELKVIELTTFIDNIVKSDVHPALEKEKCFPLK